MGVDVGETWNFIEVFHTFLCNFPPSCALDFLCNRYKLRDDFVNNSNAYNFS